VFELDMLFADLDPPSTADAALSAGAAAFATTFGLGLGIIGAVRQKT
jgi:hypothetical protein